MKYYDIPIEKLPHRDVADILIVTATPIETEKLHEKLVPIYEGGILKVTDKKNVYYLAKLGDYNIVHCQCGSMGTQAARSSMITTSDAIETWTSVKCVIMAGIAFGMYDEDGQHYSDVLVASKIVPYENQRLNADDSIDYRGQAVVANQKMIDAFSVVSDNWHWKNINDEDTCIEICPLLSGEKLVDNLEERNKLKVSFSECRGGEMEGIGIASVCSSKDKAWILLKGICDFADGNKGENKKQKQANAAEAAVNACRLALATDNFAALIGERLDFHYIDDIDLTKVFFIHYDIECEPYYLVRKIDSDVYPFLMKKNCWVYGKSGMGKSELLTRNLLFNGCNVVYIDLSLCDKVDSTSAFRQIYDSICDLLVLQPEENLSYDGLIKKIAILLDHSFKNNSVYLLIDEIPFSDKDIFNDFVDKVCSMIKYVGRNYRNVKVYFMLSSIVSPLEILNDSDIISKYEQHIKFIELERWTGRECSDLIAMLSKSASVVVNADFESRFISISDNSPRKIKKYMQEACAIGIYELTEDSINRLN